MTPRRVMAVRWGAVSQVGIEGGVAGGAVMLGVSDVEAARPVAEEAAEVVQRAAAAAVAIPGVAAAWARPAAVVMGAPGAERRREIVATGDALGAVGNIL